MAFEFTITQSVTNENRSVQNSNTYSASAKTSVDETIESDAVAQEVDFSVPVADVKALYIVASHDLTVKTNSNGSPDDTIDLKGGVPYVWATDSYDDLIFGTDIEKLYVTHGTPTAGEDGTLNIECLYDPTP